MVSSSTLLNPQLTGSMAALPSTASPGQGNSSLSSLLGGQSLTGASQSALPGANLQGMSTTDAMATLSSQLSTMMAALSSLISVLMQQISAISASKTPSTSLSSSQSAGGSSPSGTSSDALSGTPSSGSSSGSGSGTDTGGTSSAGSGSATPEMQKLAQAGKQAAMAMGGYNSQGLCATGVEHALSAIGINGVHGNGNSIGPSLAQHGFKQVHMSLADALKIPGLILSWQTSGTGLGQKYGHTAITQGDGKSSTSDFIERDTLAGASDRTGLTIWAPSDSSYS